MKKIVSLVYKLGFRPKYGSVFHSPSLSYLYMMKRVGKQVQKELQKRLDK